MGCGGGVVGCGGGIVGCEREREGESVAVIETGNGGNEDGSASQWGSDGVPVCTSPW